MVRVDLAHSLSKERGGCRLAQSGLWLATWLLPVTGRSDRVREKGSPNQQGGRWLNPQMICFPCLQSTFWREKQKKEKWINLSSVKLPGGASGQCVALKHYSLFSLIMMLYIAQCLSFISPPLSFWLDYGDIKVNLMVWQNSQLS